MPYSTQFSDTYYSKDDGRLECDHVFIKGNGLDQRFVECGHFVLAELGFGTGLNFLETMRQFRNLAPSGSKLHFHSFEMHPLSGDNIQRALVPWPEISDEAQALIEHWPLLTAEFQPYHMFQFGDDVQLHLHIGDANKTILNTDFIADAWYFDGFTPAKNQALWSLDLMQQVAKRTADSGTFASYTAAGWVRRNLVEAGFNVEKCGGFAGKRDMIKGVKVSI